MNDQFKYDVIFCHNSKDNHRVKSLANRLNEAGVIAWFDESDITSCNERYFDIERAMQEARVLVLCMSKAFFSSDWVKLERSSAIFRDPSNKERRFIPILLEYCDIPDTLDRYKRVDFLVENDGSFAELLRVCNNSVDLCVNTKSYQVALAHNNYKAHNHFINSLFVTYDNKYLVTVSWDDTIKVWDIKTIDCELAIKLNYNFNITAACVNFDSTIIIAATKMGIYSFDFTSGNEIGRYNPHCGRIYDIKLVNKHNVVLTAGEDGQIIRSNVDTKYCDKILKGHEKGVLAIDVSPDGQYVVSGSYDCSVKYWDVHNEKCILSFEGHSRPVRAVKLMKDEKFILSSSDDRTIKLWDINSSKCIGTFEGHQWEVMSLAVSPNKSLFASTGFTDGTIRIWDMLSGKCVQVLTCKDKSSFISLMFSIDGEYLIAGTGLTGNIYFYKMDYNNARLAGISSRKYINAKIVLMGESGVGKTALAYRLKEDIHIKPDSTHGMNAWPIELPLPVEDNVVKEALLWDLAGQEDYKLIHQLYLDETALALVLFNPQSNDPFAEPKAWVKALEVAKRRNASREDVPKILVAGRVDVGRLTISQQKIDNFAKEFNFSECIKTSAKSGLNCSDSKANGFSKLKYLITKYINWNVLPWVASDNRLINLKNTIFNINRNENIKLIRFTELFQRIRYTYPELDFHEDETRSIIASLSNQLLVIKLKFGDLILLVPELLNSYASAIIREARDHIDEIGCVAEADIINKKISFENVERLSDQDEDIFLRAIVQTLIDNNICIVEDTSSGRQLIFPCQYKKDKLISSYPTIYVSYSFEGDLKSVYSTIVVRLWCGMEYKNKELWNNAAEFYTSSGKLIGLMLEKNDDGGGTIHVFCESSVTDDMKYLFVGYVFNQLTKHATNVNRLRRYICRCGKPILDMDVVNDRLKNGKEFIVCQKCDDMVPLNDNIDNLIRSNQIMQSIRVIDQETTRKLDNQAMEQILLGHMLSICGEANQIFRPVSMFDYGIDGEIEFKDLKGIPSGNKIYVQLKNGASYLEYRQRDGKEIFYVKNTRHLTYWVQQPVDVYLVIRDSESMIRWMNISEYLKHRHEKSNTQIVFEGIPLNIYSLLMARDRHLISGSICS